jgi:putative PIN family toxin of toxin-antitoxin system
LEPATSLSPDSPTEKYEIRKGDSFWKIAASQLGEGATDADILKQTQILMELNPGLDPRTLKVGSDINIVGLGSGIEVSPDTRGAYAASDAEYQGYLADEALADTNIIGDDGLRIGPTIERAKKEGLLQNTNATFDALTALEALSASTLYGEAAIKAGIQVPRALGDQRAGFRTELVMEADGSPRLGAHGQEKIKVFGPNAVLEGRDLPATFRYADADNARHLAAKGLQTKVRAGLLDDIKERHNLRVPLARHAVSAARSDSPQRLTLHSSPVLLEELTDVITRPALTRRLASIGKTAHEVLAGYLEAIALVEPPRRTARRPRDPDDDHVLACALAAAASLIVSGDPVQQLRANSRGLFNQRQRLILLPQLPLH